MSRNDPTPDAEAPPQHSDTDAFETAVEALASHDAVRVAHSVRPTDGASRIIVAVADGVETAGPLTDLLKEHDLRIWTVDFEWRTIRLVPADELAYPELGGGAE